MQVESKLFVQGYDNPGFQRMTLIKIQLILFHYCSIAVVNLFDYFGDKVAQLVRCRTSDSVGRWFNSRLGHFGLFLGNIPYCHSLPSGKMGT